MMIPGTFKTAAVGLVSALALAALAGCTSEDILTTDTTNANLTNQVNAGTVSAKNFSVLASDPFPEVIDDDGNFVKTSVTIEVNVGDRNDQFLTDAHTVFFRTEYGLIEPSCVTEDGTCSVTWTAIDRPPGSIPASADGVVSITAYTIGEEAFVDSNGNRTFDDNDASFTDLEEPYVDIDENGVYNAGDFIIDVPNPNDPTGRNGLHDVSDTLFNGGGCTHTTLCSPATSIYIWTDIALLITGPP